MQRWIHVTLAIGLAGLMVGCQQQEFANKKAAMRDQWDKSRSTMVAQLAVEAYEHGELTQARERCLEALSSDRDNLTLRLLLVRIYIEEGNYDAARRHLAMLDQADTQSWEVPYYFGVCYEQQRHFADALKSYDKAHEMAPQAVEPVQAATEVLVQMGKTKQAQARVKGKIDVTDPDAHLCELAGRLAIREKDYKSAELYFQLAHDADPKNLRYPEMLAVCHRQNGDHHKVVSVLESQLQNPGYKPTSHVHLMLGEAYLTKGQIRQAIQNFEAAVKATPDDMEAWNTLCGAYLADGNYRRAVEAGRKAEELSPDNVETALLLGYALTQTGETTQATFVLQSAVRHNPKDVLILCVLGRTMMKQGKIAEAKQLFARASQLDPSSQMARVLAAQTVQ